MICFSKMEKIIKSSRAFPLGRIDFYQAYFPEEGGFVFFVKKCETFYDVLAFFVQSSYLCRYKFPILWNQFQIYEWLYNNGTIQKAFSRPFTPNKEK